MCFVMEDLHWADASTLEWLSLLIDQVPTARLLVLLIFRPDFRPPWAGAFPPDPAHAQPLDPPPGGGHGRSGSRAARRFRPRCVQQLVATTDGVPLFVEELTKMVLESGLVKEREGAL